MVIPTAGGRLELLRRTLASLAECARPAGYAGTVVIENGRYCGADAVVREFADSLHAEYMYCREGNKSLALNAVLERVGDELLVFLDDDVRVSRQLLQAYSDAAVRGSENVFFGGPVGVDYEVEPPEWLRRALPTSARGWEWHGGDDITTPAFMGFNWAAWANDLRRLGGFDSEFGPGAPTGARGQESNMQQRLLADGYVGRYVGDARVWHWVPQSRSTPEWALDRAYHTGRGWGMSLDNPPTVFGWPRPILRLLARQATREVAAALSFYPPWRFLARRWRWYTRGVLESWREKAAKERSE